MLSKARHAVFACNGGVPRVHVIDGTLDEGLLGEVFDNHGYGTLIHANEYDNIRPAKRKDVHAIQMLTRQAVEAEELLERTKSSIERHLDDYFIFEIDKNPRGLRGASCLSRREPGRALACLYVSPSHDEN